MLLPDIRGAACESLPDTTVLAVCVLARFSSFVRGVMAETDEVLYLCFVLRREVRFASKGFISGGKLAIFLKTKTSQMSRKSDRQWRPATVVATSQEANKTLSVSPSVGKKVRQRPGVPASSSQLRLANRTVKM